MQSRCLNPQNTGKKYADTCTNHEIVCNRQLLLGLLDNSGGSDSAEYGTSNGPNHGPLQRNTLTKSILQELGLAGRQVEVKTM